jgi:hypothetical protein
MESALLAVKKVLGVFDDVRYCRQTQPKFFLQTTELLSMHRYNSNLLQYPAAVISKVLKLLRLGFPMTFLLKISRRIFNAIAYPILFIHLVLIITVNYMYLIIKILFILKICYHYLNPMIQLGG